MKIHFGNVKRNIAEFFSAAWRQRLGKVLLCLCGAFVITAAVIGIYLYNQGGSAANNARQLLAKYEAETAQSDTAQPAVPFAANSSILKIIDGYQVMGTLEIQKIGQTLPIISQTTDNALGVSACYYTGALPGEKGNMVITGHNYADGSIFGKLDQLKAGDTVIFDTPTETYTYQVYNTKTITPDDASALEDYQGDYSLTLLTCTDMGNERLLVQCGLQGQA